jgi:hypothetical protein
MVHEGGEGSYQNMPRRSMAVMETDTRKIFFAAIQHKAHQL